MVRLLVAIAAALVATSSAVQAHTGIGDTNGFLHGLAHPISGVDHALAMVAVGLFAAHLGGRALWLVPATFVTMMAAGGTLGMIGVEIQFVELGIGFSVVVLGLVVSLQVNMASVAAMALVGFFAIFHGHAHGAEMPETASGFEYGVGFILATSTLHAIGIGIGLLIGRMSQLYGRRVLQTAGGAMAVTGVAILAGYV
jgi:urease accessory protein